LGFPPRAFGASWLSSATVAIHPCLFAAAFSSTQTRTSLLGSALQSFLSSSYDLVASFARIDSTNARIDSCFGVSVRILKGKLMKSKVRIISIVGLTGIVWSGSSFGDQQLVTINFDQSPWQDYSVYTEKGFSLTPNVGKVRINDAFSPGNMAAQPSFGFGQGMDSSFTFSNEQHWAFNALSIDLLEASDYPDTFGVTMIGTRTNTTIATQTFTLDGIPGAQTFFFSPDFTNLVSLKIAKNASDRFDVDIVQIDNVQFSVPLAGTQIRTRTGIYGQAFITRTNTISDTSLKIPTLAVVWVYDSHGRRVRTLVSNPVGQFYTFLPPGDYTVVGTSTGRTAELRSHRVPQFRSDSVPVTVYANQFTDVELNCATIVQ
jgi:hypothetical protein